MAYRPRIVSRATVRRRHNPFWPGRLALLAAILLGLALPSDLTLGPFWPLPAVPALTLPARAAVLLPAS